ncbi:potassium-transporting ATPase subunit F [Gallaecimonas mangrovi]
MLPILVYSGLFIMNWLYLLVVVGLLCYLGFALVKPEQ